ncbi:hypothetical protein BBP40_009222 [Aspergillus hancockii]|nr:hypothetical protein BBP40_009222 [Aspergillus hancockii]
MRSQLSHGGIDTVGLNPGISTTLIQFGIAAAKQLTTVEDRILNQPNTVYRGVSAQQVPGSWNMRSVKFNNPSQQLHKWSVAPLDTRTLSVTGRDAI